MPSATPWCEPTPNITQASLAANGDLQVAFDNGHRAAFNPFWLRDNDPSSFHPVTQERTFDLLALPDDLQISQAQLSATGQVTLHWAHDALPSHFAPAWLWQHRPGQRRVDPAHIAPTTWQAADWLAQPVRYAAADIARSDAALRDWLVDTQRWGLSIVHGIAQAADAGMQIARRVGFLRETNFGQTFEVVNKPDPNNLAYTAIELPLHTDLPNQELVPGFQFLHCIANQATGGGSVFADGYAIAHALRQQDPAAFATLAQVPVPFRFFDTEADIRVRRPIITLDTNVEGEGESEVREIAYNAHIADILDLPSAQASAWYRAYRAFMRLTRAPAFRLCFKLAPGEMVVFDNRRILHGREAFNPASGLRHLQGCYVDRGEFESRLRLLGRAV